MEVSYSFCNPKDKFDKKLGKKIALNRLESNKVFVCQLDENSNRHTITRDVLMAMFFVVDTPGRVSKFIQSWLDKYEEKLWDFLRKNWRNVFMLCCVLRRRKT